MCMSKNLRVYIDIYLSHEEILYMVTIDWYFDFKHHKNKSR